MTELGPPAVMTYFARRGHHAASKIIDPVTKQFQTETKALLNVSPRNVFHAWTLASLGRAERIQPMPPTVTLLLP